MGTTPPHRSSRNMVQRHDQIGLPLAVGFLQGSSPNLRPRWRGRWKSEVAKRVLAPAKLGGLITAHSQPSLTNSARSREDPPHSSSVRNNIFRAAIAFIVQRGFL